MYNPVRSLYNQIVKPKTDGVKVIMKNNDGKYLLVRIGYAHRKWTWPGGKVDRVETALTAARRELKEESGLEVKDLIAIGDKGYNQEGKRDTVYFFAGETTSIDLIIDGQEIIDAGWFDLHELPEPLSGTVSDGISALNKQSV